jgi:hypothetical protein
VRSFKAFQSRLHLVFPAEARTTTIEKEMVMEIPAEDTEPTGVVEVKTSDGLKLQVHRTRSNAYVRVNEDALRVGAEFGSCDPDFIIPLICQLAKLGIKGNNFDPEIIKFAIAFVKGIAPRDQISALLGAQMVTVHLTLLFNVSRINQARFLQYNEEEEQADRAVARLARTYMALTEAFDRHQNGGEQKLALRHMTVAQDGRASADSPTQPAKTSQRRKRGIQHMGMNGHQTAVNNMKRHGKFLLEKTK